MKFLFLSFVFFAARNMRRISRISVDKKTILFPGRFKVFYTNILGLGRLFDLRCISGMDTSRY